MTKDDTSTTMTLTLEQTDDIAMTIDDVLKDKPDIVKVITNDGNIERSLLLRELLMNAYIRGFFAGMQHTMRDLMSEENGKKGH